MLQEEKEGHAIESGYGPPLFFKKAEGKNMNVSPEERYRSAISALRRQLVACPTNREAMFNNGVLCGMSKIKEVWGRDMEDQTPDTRYRADRKPRSAEEKLRYAVDTLQDKLTAKRRLGKYQEAYCAGIRSAIRQIEIVWGAVEHSGTPCRVTAGRMWYEQ